MSNTFLTISMITREALRVLENNMVFAKRVTRTYDDKFAIEGAKIGTTLNIRKPPRYLGRTGATLTTEDVTEQQVALTLSTQAGVDITMTSQDLKLNIDDFSKRLIKPAINNVANRIDNDGLALLTAGAVYNEIGTPGTVPNAALTYLQAGQRLDEEGAPRGNDRSLVINPGMQATIVDALKGLFQSSTDIAKQYQTGEMGRGLGFDWFMDQNCPTFTVGAQGGTPLVNGASQTGASIITNGWTASKQVLNKGDVITFAGVYAVNPVSRVSTGALRQWVVTANVTSDATGNATIPISGPGGAGIVTTGAFQNCTGSPANAAAVSVSGAGGTSSGRGVAFHPDAFALASADLPLPGGVDMAASVADKEVGLSIRLIRAYDVNTDRFPTRLDVLYGWLVQYPELAVRVAS